jgi:hypothetical protein
MALGKSYCQWRQSHKDGERFPFLSRKKNLLPFDQVRKVKPYRLRFAQLGYRLNPCSSDFVFQ